MSPSRSTVVYERLLILLFLLFLLIFVFFFVFFILFSSSFLLMYISSPFLHMELDTFWEFLFWARGSGFGIELDLDSDRLSKQSGIMKVRFTAS